LSHDARVFFAIALRENALKCYHLLSKVIKILWEKTTMSIFEKHVFVCENDRDPTDPRGCCKARGAEAFVSTLKKLCRESGLKDKVRVNKAGCLDMCAFGPVVVVYPEGVWYKGVTAADAEEIFREHILANRPVERLLLRSKKG
jgi:(2Fe-2S) ferredoxin